MRSAQCPYCGHHTRNCRPHAGDLTSLLARAQHLEEIIDSLAQERSSILQHVNDLQPTTKSLPTEVLSAIFRNMCQPIQDNHDDGIFQPVPDHLDDANAAKFVNLANSYEVLPRSHIPPWRILGSVCSEWRAVAWSTPQLWVTFSAEVSARNVSSVASLLRLHLRNAGNHLLSIELDMTNFEKGLPRSVDPENYMIVLEKHRPLEDLLFTEYPEHFRSFCLTYPPEDWFYGEMKQTNLDTIALRWPDRYANLNSHSFTHLPRLRRVFLTNWQLAVSRESKVPTMMLCWDSITVLDFNNIEFEVCVEMLVRCRNLRSYKMLNQSSVLASEFGETRLNIPSEMLFQHLEQLTWTVTKHRYHISILRALQLPSIRSITFHGQYKHVIENHVLPTFFAGLTSSLQSLSFHEDRTKIPALEHILPHIPRSLTHLRLERCCGSVHYIFPFLFPDTTPLDACGQHIFADLSKEFPFPELTYLECRNTGGCSSIIHEDSLPVNVDFGMDSFDWEWDWLLDFINLKARLGLGKKFHLTIPYERSLFYDRGHVPRSFMREILCLNENGFEITQRFVK